MNKLKKGDIVKVENPTNKDAALYKDEIGEVKAVTNNYITVDIGDDTNYNFNRSALKKINPTMHKIKNKINNIDYGEVKIKIRSGEVYLIEQVKQEKINN